LLLTPLGISHQCSLDAFEQSFLGNWHVEIVFDGKMLTVNNKDGKDYAQIVAIGTAEDLIDVLRESRDHRIHQRFPEDLELGKRPFLIPAHQPATSAARTAANRLSDGECNGTSPHPSSMSKRLPA
jgi:hypothetical protein